MKIHNQKITHEEIYSAVINKEKIEVNKKLLSFLDKQRKEIEGLIHRGEIIYGITTGFGALKDKLIPPEDLERLQENIIKSHAVGVGKPFPKKIVKTIMILIVLYLVKGFSGVHSKIVQALLKMINNDVIPVVPEKGSVGSSGDLAPSAHIVLVLLGKGETYFNGIKMPGRKALKKAHISPIKLKAKEGLALINNTSTMTANAIFALSQSKYLSYIANLSASLSMEALRASKKAFDERIHQLKPYKNQIAVASRIRKLLLGSTMEDKNRIQDQYSIRCIPQVHGAIKEAIEFVEKIVNIEINSVTDNPLIFNEGKKIEAISGGNFHGEALAIAMDTLRLSICELANISDRRIASLLDTNHNFGLPPFLARESGLNSGMMILQYTTAALVSENKILAHPAVVDSIPTSTNVEDFVSMGTISARKTLEVVENVKTVLAIEILTTCQAIDFRLKQGFKLGKGTARLFKKIRKKIPFFKEDQEYCPHINTIVNMIDNRKL